MNDEEDEPVTEESTYSTAVEHEIGEYRLLLKTIHMLAQSPRPEAAIREIASLTTADELDAITARSIAKANGA